MIVQADILTWAETHAESPGNGLFHAVMCDPPYGLNESEVNIHDVLNDWMNDREHRPKGAGFMGREWDAFLPGPRIWRAIRRCCHPGALLFAFGGTRTADLLGLALRLAGWEKVDQILHWGYGSGFPKNHHIGRAIDRAAKAERPIVGTRRHQPKFDAAGFEYRKKDNGYNSKDRETFSITAPATEMARVWDGYGTALKPAHEPILVFRNPFKGTYAENCTRTGAGALWVDGARIGWDAKSLENDTKRRQSPGTDITGGRYIGGENGAYDKLPDSPAGRWPPNLCLTHHPDCEPLGTRRVRGTKGEADYTKTGVQGPVSIVTNVKTGRHYADADGHEEIADWQCVEGCPVRRMGEMSGETPVSWRKAQPDRAYPDSIFPQPAKDRNERGHTDQGTAARFFYQSDWQLERLEAADPVGYYAKASRTEREAGLDDMHVRLMRDLYGVNEDAFEDDSINDGRKTPIDNPYQRGETMRHNSHPCIKPLSLCRWLSTLLLPPVEYAPRRLLIPFSGTGSEMIGADLAGWEEIVGVELSEEYVRIAEVRIAFWKAMRHKMKPGEPIKIRTAAPAPDGQLTMF